jgi:predicted amidohydrolase
MKVAAIQMVSRSIPETNIRTAETLLRQAKTAGAELAVLPEYWSIMGLRDTDKIASAEQATQGVLQTFMSQMAQELQMIIVGGTIPLKSDDAHKIYNACLVFDPSGVQIARYDKIHLFGFSNGDESYQESNTIQAGNDIVSFDSRIGKIGLGICYDLRFPELFRNMGSCSLLILPAAFTYTTGQAHWEILLRARAIENQCYVLASAQGGTHDSGRRTWGHSMVIDPWGKVLNCLEEGEGIVIADLALDAMQKIRDNLPALKHRRFAC